MSEENKSKILIADDNEMDLCLLENMLIQHNYVPIKANNGKEALDILNSDEECQMVITDWDMPEMNGPELCRKIRKNISNYVYIIILTASSSRGSVVEGLAAGADDYIVKPFNPAELAVRLLAGRRVVNLESHELLIYAMAKLAESRDPETGFHLERVRNYCRLLALNLYENGKYPEIIDPDFIRLVYNTSPMHDIGKVGIPDRILQKPGRLTPEEFELMKQHTVIGGETLEAALNEFPYARYLRVAYDIAMCHHEKWDGSGYPKGLVGEQIPISARVMAVADVYDALTSKRVYKEAFSHEKACDIITKDSGTHFDPTVIEAFKQLSEKFDRIRASYEDIPLESILEP
ncbi:MAG: response regulator [Sedimentisphaerales bacterium]|nr:response regulator [Sedimentisphaerales bacterium]